MSKPLTKTYQHLAIIPDTQPINTRIYFTSLNNLSGKKITGLRFDKGDTIGTRGGDYDVLYTEKGTEYFLVTSLFASDFTITLQRKDGAYSFQDFPISSCGNLGLAAGVTLMMREPFFPIEGIYDFDNSYITVINTLAAAPGGRKYGLLLNFKYED